MRRLKISTSQIAKICDVSQGTVDRALNNRPDISAATKQKILDVVKQYGYRDEVDLGGVEKTSGQIGIIVFNLNNEYFSDLITELEYALRQENLGTVVMMSHYDKQYEIECIRNLYNMGVSGIVLCSVNDGDEFKNYLDLFDIPIIAVGNNLSFLPYVGIDDFSAMGEITAKTAEEGFENIIYFSPALKYSDAYAQRRRYEGFLNAIGSRRYSVVTDIDEIKFVYDQKTAIICSNDYYALKVYFKGCNAKIIGFDNIRALDNYNIPIDSVGYSMGEIAKEVISSIKENKKSDTLIKHKIITRK